MSSSINSFEEILSVSIKLSERLLNANKYLAHLSPDENRENDEKLEEHLSLVNSYFIELCKQHKLDSVIDSLIIEWVQHASDKKNLDRLCNYVKLLFINVIVFHDYGKVNENFQAERMKNNLFKSIKSPLQHHHALLGTYLFNTSHWSEISKMEDLNEQEKGLLFITTLWLSYSITNHHKSRLNDLIDDIDFEEEYITFCNQYLELYNFEVCEPYKNDWFRSDILKNIKLSYLEALPDNSFALFALIKLNFSLLTASDYLATSHYIQSWNSSLTNYGVLNPKLKYKIVNSFSFTQPYNKKLYEEWDTIKNTALANLAYPSPDNLNMLRLKLSVEVAENLRANIDKRLFYIEAPTGGGKTNLSMLVISELLKHDIEIGNNEITKVFYVFPFTTLITQTYDTLQKTFQLEEDELIQLHSKAGFHEKKEEDLDGLYGIDKINYIDNLFAHYPITLLSHIKFFDILKSNTKEINYLMHRLANSIVIIDELQSYSPSEWDKITYFLDEYSKHFNIRFVLMSATLPKLGSLKTVCDVEIVNLVSNKESYFQNANFANRVKFNFELLQHDLIELDSLADIVVSKSKNYAESSENLNPGSVYTIVEFIFKKTASQFFILVKAHEYFDEVLVLSGTILEPKRKEIIAYLKNKENRQKKVLLITTQVVEAGVDIDMDLGFKNQSLADSDEQLAGRINRNVNKPECTLYLFKIDDPEVIYGKDKRFEATKKLLHQDENSYKSILKTKNFDLLYKKVFDLIDEANLSRIKKSFIDFKNEVNKLAYNEVDRTFRLIDQQNYSVFVPLNLPILNNNGKGEVLQKNEMIFLQNHKIYSEGEEQLSGIKVWELYEKIILNKSLDFTSRAIQLKKLQGIMSKFIFSMFAYSSEYKILLSFGQEKYGFLYLENHKSCYDYNYGIADDKEELINFNFL